MSRTDSLQISTAKASTALTPEQKRFNTLIRQIEQARQSLAAWYESIGEYRQAHAEVVLPLENAVMAAHRQWVLALDALMGQRGWTKAERHMLRELVCEAAGGLLMNREDDEQLKALFAKHAKTDFDTERREMARAMKGLTEAMTGLDLGDDEGIHTDADLFERMQRGLEEQAAAEESQRNERAAHRRKSAAQQRREAEAQQATQSVREIFRKLASALHPDRETDARQRETKTALMQRVNQAYAANDLLGLLELQLEIEQIDASHIANANAQRLKHYNKVLSEQLAELRAEVEHVEIEFCLEFGLEPDRRIKPSTLGLTLEHNSRQLRAELAELQRELRMLTDVAATKRWLKRQRQLLRVDEFDLPF